MISFASPLRDRRTATVVVGVVAALVFGNALANGFAYDDESIVVNNTGIQSLATLPGAVFKTPYWPNYSGEQVGLWRPVTTALLGLEYVVSGGSPLMFHAVNVVAHAHRSWLSSCSSRIRYRCGRSDAVHTISEPTVVGCVPRALAGTAVVASVLALQGERGPRPVRRADVAYLVMLVVAGVVLWGRVQVLGGIASALGVCAAEAQAAGQDGSGVCGDVADWGHDGLGRGVADESGWLGGRREGRAGVPRSFHRRDGVGHGALRRPGGCAAA